MGMKSAEFGIEGYFLAKTANTAYEKPLLAKILPGKKRTFIDEEIAKKKFVPPAIYEVAKSLIITGHKSNLDKGRVEHSQTILLPTTRRTRSPLLTRINLRIVWFTLD